MFDELKSYLGSAPLPNKLESGKELYLYLAVSLGAINSVFIRKERKTQKLVYYVSKVLHDVEMRYLKLEKMIYATRHDSQEAPSLF